MTLTPRLVLTGVTLIVLLPAVTVIELRSASIPNALTRATLVVGVASVLIARDAYPVVGALVGGAVPLLARRLTGGGVGWGDVKLSFGLGALLGPAPWGYGLLAAALAALGGVALDRLVTADASSCEAGIPFGPYLVGGGLVALVMEMSHG
ncbi:MAG: prepilin peptidase [Spirochaetota bacterium]